MVENETIWLIHGKNYFYNKSYDRLELITDTDDPWDSMAQHEPSSIRCPKCHNDKFTIGYGHYECYAYCKCGHRMTIYDG